MYKAILASLAFVTIALTSGAVADNDPQTVTTSTCATYNALYEQDVAEPLGNVVVQGGTRYSVSSSGVNTVDVIVDFFNAAGQHVGATDLGYPIFSPPSATSGVVCARALNNFPTAPDLTAMVTFEDGL